MAWRQLTTSQHPVVCLLTLKASPRKGWALKPILLAFVCAVVHGDPVSRFSRGIFYLRSHSILASHKDVDHAGPSQENVWPFWEKLELGSLGQDGQVRRRWA